MIDLPLLFLKTLILRPYVFVFLIAFLISARWLLGWRRTSLFLLVSWITAFLCEFSSTRIGIPFGFYILHRLDGGEELYLFNVPFMDSLSFTFLLYASYCLALIFLLPSVAPSDPRRLQLTLDPTIRTSGPVLLLTAMFLTFMDVVIDPVALRGDRWSSGGLSMGIRSQDCTSGFPAKLSRVGDRGPHCPLRVFLYRPTAPAIVSQSWGHSDYDLSAAWVCPVLWRADL